MTHYVKTDTILDKILARKVEEIAAARRMFDDAIVLRQSLAYDEPVRDFAAALQRASVALVAEVKHASPSQGVLIADFDPPRIARTYAHHGAAAISVLTDRDFFRGELGFLNSVRAVVDVPILRKDFIIDPFQLHVMRATQIMADAALLIVAALDDPQLADLHATITGLGMAALVEVHNQQELERALTIGAPLIGINNRDLRTFNVDLATTEQLAAQVPAGVTLIAESGIRHPDDVRQMGRHGAHAVLVGEALVTAADMAAQVRALAHVPRATASRR